jgi:hypothetical protein
VRDLNLRPRDGRPFSDYELNIRFRHMNEVANEIAAIANEIADRRRVADIFFSYTSRDQNWAFWIGKELKRLGHVVHIHEWEIGAGGDIVAWMETCLKSADHALFVVSKAYLAADYSSWERQAEQWAAGSARSNFLLPIFVENCEPPRLWLLARLRRCDLYGLAEVDARGRLAAYLASPQEPAGAVLFPGVTEAANASLA